MKAVLQVGLLGSGAYGRVHARVYMSDQRVNLKALWSPTKVRRESVAERFCCRPADTWREIVDDPAVDCVAVATPDFAHTEYAVAALEAGKHVLLEKPMAMSTGECKRIIAARDRGGGKLMVNYHNRWYPAFVAARDAIAAGRIGKPVCGNFVLSDTIDWVEQCMTWSDKTGPEWFLMTHIADLAFWMLDDKPAEIFAMARKGLLQSKGLPTRDLVKATMKMQSGAVIHFESSWVLARHWRNPLNDMCLSVQGEEGRVDAVADYEGLTLTTDRHTTPFVLSGVTEDQPIRDFVTCVLEDKPIPVTGEQGLLATQAIEAVVASYQQNRVVSLDEIQ